MRWTIHFPASDRLRESLGRRGTAFLLALVLEALLLLMLLTFVPIVSRPEKPKPVLIGFDLDSGEKAETKKADKARTRSARGGARSEQPKAAEPVVPPLPPPPSPKADVLWLPRTAYAATDITNAPTHAPDPAASDPGEGISHADDSQVAQGKGPHGETLYVAEWYRRPTHAELNTYLPPGARETGWGEIYCRTAERYRVEDCQELGNAPRGSGYAGAVRQASFQFLVRPPRKGGKSLVGAMVLIHIDYIFTEKASRLDSQ